MTQERYRGRRAATIENADLRVTVLVEGGHIAEIFDKASGVNPLWTPPWPTIEPSAYWKLNRDPFSANRVKKDPDLISQARYGGDVDGPLLAGIMGHNLCLDIFGPPSDEEAREGLTAHGEGSVAHYDLDVTGGTLTARAQFPIAGLQFERRVTLGDRVVRIRETLKNLRSVDRPIGWTQHVTLGPPFLERGATQFRSSATRSKVFESTFGDDDYLRPAAEFEWPMAPKLDGGAADLRMFTDAERSSAYTAHVMDPNQSAAYFIAFSPALPPRLRLRVEAGRLSVDGHLGRKPQPHESAVERPHAGTWLGVRRVADAGDARSDGAPENALRRSHVSPYRLGGISRRGVLRSPAAGTGDS